jgi:hypothetical protein
MIAPDKHQPRPANCSPACLFPQNLGSEAFKEHMMRRKNTNPRTSQISRPRLIFVGSDKGGGGKSFISSLVADLSEITGVQSRIVQIDE